MDNIPKIIHFCWFGKNEKTELIKKCIASWKKYLLDYEIVEWNEENFDINSNQFVQEAYKEKKWAFVSDYVRLFALYHHGGIYLDTDIEMLREADAFLDKGCFGGFEDEVNISTGIMGAVKHHPLMGKLLSYYENRSFYLQNGELDITTNVEIITNICIEDGFISNGKFQVLNNGIHIYPKDYFCPKEYSTGKINLTKNTHCIHHFDGSWLSKDKKIRRSMKLFLISILGEKMIERILGLRKRLVN